MGRVRSKPPDRGRVMGMFFWLLEGWVGIVRFIALDRSAVAAAETVATPMEGPAIPPFG
jgi:hypothetical protein